MNENGRIKTKTLSGSGVLAIGMVGATGTWVNQQTGTHGTFTTFGFGAGLAAGATLTAPSYSSIGAFTGMSDGFSIGASIGVGGGRLGIGGGYSKSWNDSGSGGGGTFDVGSVQLPSVSFAGTWTDTQISKCQRAKGMPWSIYPHCLLEFSELSSWSVRLKLAAVHPMAKGSGGMSNPSFFGQL
ncbi:hypothetical protein [Sphingomonas kyeonggiensis]|uniref:Uncharacterized protein n=1 Tax=Sphingomonas kyeonggiensis TaxID=1268553 RepID=A0A7W6NYU1_9SPHN|nr:hypothetical protein [Sphingomonas kyeonggiensis]MBB4099969.1 hypothetical protein [Sphingomonas kyeonggiensis]